MARVSVAPDGDAAAAVVVVAGHVTASASRGASAIDATTNPCGTTLWDPRSAPRAPMNSGKANGRQHPSIVPSPPWTTRRTHRDDDGGADAEVAAVGGVVGPAPKHGPETPHPTWVPTTPRGATGTAITTRTSRCPAGTACGRQRGTKGTNAGVVPWRIVRRTRAPRAREAAGPVAAAGDGDPAREDERTAARDPPPPNPRDGRLARDANAALRPSRGVNRGVNPGAMPGSRGADAATSRRSVRVTTRTTRASNSWASTSRGRAPPAATFARSPTTSSSKAASPRCRTCPAGSRRSASSSPAISTPAADRRGATTDGVADADGCRHGQAVRSQAVRSQAVRCQLVQAQVT